MNKNIRVILKTRVMFSTYGIRIKDCSGTSFYSRHHIIISKRLMLIDMLKKRYSLNFIYKPF